MKASLEIQLLVRRTVEIPDEYLDYTPEDVDEFINENFVENQTIIEAINDYDYDIDDYWWHIRD
jgi:hypothetical protein